MGEIYDNKLDVKNYISMQIQQIISMMMMMCMLPVINMKGVQDMEGREEVSYNMTWIPSFAWNFPFTSVYVYTNRNDFPLCISLF